VIVLDYSGWHTSHLKTGRAQALGGSNPSPSALENQRLWGSSERRKSGLLESKNDGLSMGTAVPLTVAA
jgi:hypothetical protein